MINHLMTFVFVSVMKPVKSMFISNRECGRDSRVKHQLRTDRKKVVPADRAGQYDKHIWSQYFSISISLDIYHEND